MPERNADTSTLAAPPPAPQSCPDEKSWKLDSAKRRRTRSDHADAMLTRFAARAADEARTALPVLRRQLSNDLIKARGRLTLECGVCLEDYPGGERKDKASEGEAIYVVNL